jgi:hypothetical protein
VSVAEKPSKQEDDMLGNISLGGTKRTVIGGIAVLVIAVAGAGAAIGATGTGTPQEESKAVIDATATDLGVSSASLTAALKKALIARVDAALAAGNLTGAQATDLKARINSGEVPLVGLGGGHRGGPGVGGIAGTGHFGELEAAASYLGLTATELRTAQDGGKTLAAIATEQGKNVDGLVDAMVSAVTKNVNAAVTAGTVTDAQRDSILSGLEARITGHVNNLRPDQGRGGPGGPPPMGAPDA